MNPLRRLRSLRSRRGVASSSDYIGRTKDEIIADSQKSSCYPSHGKLDRQGGGDQRRFDGFDNSMNDDLPEYANNKEVQAEEPAVIGDGHEDSPLFNAKESANNSFVSQLEKGSAPSSHFSYTVPRRRHNASEHRQPREEEFGEGVGLMTWEQSLKPPNAPSLKKSRDGSPDGSRRRRSLSSQRSCLDGRDTAPSALPPQSLYHRWDLWLALALTQLISIGSLHASTNRAYYRSTPRRSATEVAVLTFSSMSFALSFMVSVGCFHEPFREFLTTAPVAQRTSLLAEAREIATPEQYLALFILALVIIQSGLALRVGGHGAVAGVRVRNAKLFYATWIGLYGAAYLAAITTTATTIAANNSQLWLMAVFSSLCATITLCALHSGPICHGGLSGTDYCTKSLTGGLLAFFSALLSFSYATYLWDCRRRGRLPSRAAGLACASVFMVVQTGLVAVVTAPAGPGNAVGSAFLVSWFTWILGLLLWKASVASLFAPQGSPPVVRKKQRKKKQRKRREKDCCGGGNTISGGTVPDDMSESVFPDPAAVEEQEAAVEDTEKIENIDCQEYSKSTAPQKGIVKHLKSLTPESSRGGKDSERSKNLIDLLRDVESKNERRSLDASGCYELAKPSMRDTHFRTQEKTSSLENHTFVPGMPTTQHWYQSKDPIGRRGWNADVSSPSPKEDPPASAAVATSQRPINENPLTAVSIDKTGSMASHPVDKKLAISADKMFLDHADMVLYTEPETNEIPQTSSQEKSAATAAAADIKATKTESNADRPHPLRRNFSQSSRLLSNCSPIQEASVEGTSLSSSLQSRNFHVFSSRSSSTSKTAKSKSFSSSPRIGSGGSSTTKNSSKQSKGPGRPPLPPPVSPNPQLSFQSKDSWEPGTEEHTGESMSLAPSLPAIIPVQSKGHQPGGKQKYGGESLSLTLSALEREKGLSSPTTEDRSSGSKTRPNERHTSSDVKNKTFKTFSDSSSDYDIVVPNYQSEITDLTEEVINVTFPLKGQEIDHSTGVLPPSASFNINTTRFSSNEIEADDQSPLEDDSSINQRGQHMNRGSSGDNRRGGSSLRKGNSQTKNGRGDDRQQEKRIRQGDIKQKKRPPPRLHSARPGADPRRLSVIHSVPSLNTKSNDELSTSASISASDLEEEEFNC